MLSLPGARTVLVYTLDNISHTQHILVLQQKLVEIYLSSNVLWKVIFVTIKKGGRYFPLTKGLLPLRVLMNNGMRKYEIV